MALHGLHKRRSEHTVKGWIERYLSEGIAGLVVKTGRGRKPAFFPLSPMEAEQAVEYLLHQSPRQYGIKWTRWRLQDVGRTLRWLDGCTDAGIYKVLKRLGFSRKKALYFIHSPDPKYRTKWEQILRAYQEAVTHPEEVIMLFPDEFTYYRRADIRHSWQRRGRRQHRRQQRAGANTKARITAVLNALTGQVLYRQRHKIGQQKELMEFYAQIRAAYPQLQRIYLVQDNWPIHKLPAVLQAATDNQLTLCFCRPMPRGSIRLKNCGAGCSRTSCTIII